MLETLEGKEFLKVAVQVRYQAYWGRLLAENGPGGERLFEKRANARSVPKGHSSSTRMEKR